MAKSAVFARIQSALGRDSAPSDVQHPLQSHIRIQRQAPNDVVDDFLAQAQNVQMSVEMTTEAEITAAVNAYWHAHQLEGALLVADNVSTDGLDMPVATLQTDGSHIAVVTRAMAAIAETATLVVNSHLHPVPFNFLPDHHLVILERSQVIPALIDLWPRLRAEALSASAVNLITGPSRTGDIEQTIEIGAHGPRAVHVLLIDN